MLKPKNGNSLPARGTVIFASMNAAIINRITARHKNTKDSFILF